MSAGAVEAIMSWDRQQDAGGHKGRFPGFGQGALGLGLYPMPPEQP